MAFAKQVLVAAILTVLAAVELDSPALGQMYNPNYYYVDALNGSDTLGNGTRAAPWQTITHALTVALNPGGAVIRVIAQRDALGKPVRHTEPPETFPLQVKRGQRIEKDLVYSIPNTPVIISGNTIIPSTNLKPLVNLGVATGQSIGPFTGLKNLHIYDSLYPPVALFAWARPAAARPCGPNHRFEPDPVMTRETSFRATRRRA
ncbi:MAG: hypothetical protein AB1486_32900, partial [Planctomycetota bacterium]